MSRSVTARVFALCLAAAPVAALAVAPAAHAEAPAAASTWNIDEAHTTASFAVRHMMVSNVYGQFGKVTGTIVYDGKDTSTAKANVVIDATSIDTRNAKRDEHLKSADFFDVAKYPTITFQSKRATSVDGGKFKLTGDLTMHGVTKEVTLDVDAPTAEVKDPWGMTHVGTRATARVNRKDFGLNWNKGLEAGGVLVGEEVGITIDLEVTRKPAVAAGK